MSNKELNFYGPLGSHMKDFVELKRAIGNKYESEVGTLKRLDRFLLSNYPDAQQLTKAMVTEWCARTAHEKATNQCSRATVIRQFARYLDSIDIPAYILPKGCYSKGDRYVPHIYSQDELRRFFAETDKCHYHCVCPHRHLIMPVFFRLLFSCGLRASEARLLNVGDVDLDNGILTINESKNHNSRLVPMTPSITERVRTYATVIQPIPEPNAYFFPALGDNPMTLGNVYKNFRKFLWHAGISHTGDGPRVHDFRHTYAVYRLKEWSDQGCDLLTYLPILCAYLGHETYYETAYYLRLTADVFPDIRLTLEREYKDIIPEIEGDWDETD